MRPLHWLVLISLFLTACVTINVYFPAAAAERAADQIIDHVWGKESESLPPHVKPEKPSDSQSFFPPLLGFISTVSADANLDISSPTIQVIKDRMAERHPQLLPYYYDGTIGLTYDGLISLRALQQVPLKARNEVKAMF
jgi:hypothetical protein